jgi:Rieske Fe-S protein
VWENVHDWEHLPWLHGETFGSIVLQEKGRWGWRATLTLRGAEADPFEVELRRAQDAERYVVTTIAGPGTGTAITTTLTPRGEAETGVEVEFDVPGIPDDAAEAVGAGYVALYTRLWDEDEAMMRARQEELDGAGADGRRTASVGGCTVRFRPVCPHWGGPLGDVEVDADGCITCPWHGYRFDLRTGRSADGRGMLLDGWKAG